MTDINQAILISSITVVTILLTIIGFQVVLILRELRRSIEKINNIIDDFGVMSHSISHSIKDISSVTEVFKLVGKLLRIVTKNNTTGSKKNKS